MTFYPIIFDTLQNCQIINKIFKLLQVFKLFGFGSSEEQTKICGRCAEGIFFTSIWFSHLIKVSQFKNKFSFYAFNNGVRAQTSILLYKGDRKSDPMLYKLRDLWFVQDIRMDISRRGTEDICSLPEQSGNK
jgi:hypothetical protein